jgi:hypothetical protein
MAWRLQGARPPALPGCIVSRMCVAPVCIVCIDCSVRRICEITAGVADGMAPKGRQATSASSVYCIQDVCRACLYCCIDCIVRRICETTAGVADGMAPTGRQATNASRVRCVYRMCAAPRLYCLYAKARV